jgi:hypothetical protein
MARRSAEFCHSFGTQAVLGGTCAKTRFCSNTLKRQEIMNGCAGHPDRPRRSRHPLALGEPRSPYPIESNSEIAPSIVGLKGLQPAE